MYKIHLVDQLCLCFSLSQTGYIGALPHLLMTIVVPLGGLLADHIRKNGILSTTSVRKIFNCGGFGMEATFFLVLANARTPLMATIALTCGVAFSGFAISGKCSEPVLYISVWHNSHRTITVRVEVVNGPTDVQYYIDRYNPFRPNFSMIS